MTYLGRNPVGITSGAAFPIDDTAGEGDVTKVWSANKSYGEISDLKSAINSKLDSPETAGTSGQVLTSDGHGGQTWQTPSGGDVTDVQVNGVSVVTDGVANVPDCIPNPGTKSTGDFLVYNGSAWVAQSLSTWQGGNY